MHLTEIEPVMDALDFLEGFKVTRNKHYFVKGGVPHISQTFEGERHIGNITHELGHFLTCHMNVVHMRNFGLPSPYSSIKPQHFCRFAVEEYMATCAAAVLSRCLYWERAAAKYKLRLPESGVPDAVDVVDRYMMREYASFQTLVYPEMTPERLMTARRVRLQHLKTISTLTT